MDPRQLDELRVLLSQYRTHANHRLGQHFLVDPDVYETIANLVDQAEVSGVLEIGPGPGGLTRTLLEHGARVVAIEIDQVLTKMASDQILAFGSRGQVIKADALHERWQAISDMSGLVPPLAVVGNLPYYISGPLVAKLWEDPLTWRCAVFMLQKEVAERLAAPPGERASGAASVLIRYVGEPRIACYVPRQAFFPPPEVDSAILVVDRLEMTLPVSLEALRWWVRAGFQHRRKMLRQALALAPNSPWDKAGWDRHLATVGIDSGRRAESLSMADWIALAGSLPEVPLTR